MQKLEALEGNHRPLDLLKDNRKKILRNSFHEAGFSPNINRGGEEIKIGAIDFFHKMQVADYIDWESTDETYFK